MARLFRLVTGLQKRPCPTVNYDCYWCGADLFEGSGRPGDLRYVGESREAHRPDCPWIEVIAYVSLRQYEEHLDDREPDVGASAADAAGDPR